MTYTTKNTAPALTLIGLAGCVFIAGCGPDFDPGSLIENTRVIGARIEVEGAPERATPMPGETANVTWLVTSPGATPPLTWTFAACAGPSSSGTTAFRCANGPLARFDGTASAPKISIAIPSAPAWSGARNVVVYGQICSGPDSTPTVDPRNGLPGCTSGRGTTVSLDIPLQLGADANHNPNAERAFTFDREVWPARLGGAGPCAVGPQVAAGSKGHVIGNTIDGVDRETYTGSVGHPPMPTLARERLQISQFTTAGKLERQFSFVEATDARARTTVDVTWEAPNATDVPAGGLEVTFTFVTRDERGGADWTTRALCVMP